MSENKQQSLEYKILQPVPKDTTKFLLSRNDPIPLVYLNFQMKQARYPNSHLTVDKNTDNKKDNSKKKQKTIFLKNDDDDKKC